MNLNNKNVIVTGGSMGIGFAIAEILKEKGANVLITGRNKERLENAATKIGCKFFQADAGSEKDILATFEYCDQEMGNLDVLVNNAGFGKGWYGIDELVLSDLEAVYRVNVFGAALMGREASKRFKKQESGCIVNIGSTAAAKGFKNGTIYASSKFALRGMTECWRAELRPFNVRVVLVNPSEVKTAFGNDGVEKAEEVNKLRSKDIATVVANAIEMDDRGFIPEFQVWATNPW